MNVFHDYFLLVRLFWLNLWIKETKYYSKNTFLWMWCLLIYFLIMVSSVHGGKIVWCLLSTVTKLSGVFCPRWQKNVASFVHPGKNSLVSFGSGVFCPTFGFLCEIVSWFQLTGSSKHTVL